MTATPVLYEHPLSPYAQKCKIALREKNLAFEARMPDAIGSGTAGGAFAAASPRIEVPALVHEGITIFESTVIAEYIEDRWPEPPLLPASPAARARLRMIEELMDTHYEAITWALGEIRFFRRAVGTEAERLEAAAAAQLAQAHAWLDRTLGEAAWFGGDMFSMADACIAPLLNGSDGFGVGPAEGSKLAAWLARANARPSVAKTREEAVASLSGMTQVGELIASGQFRRQYRDHRLEWMMRSGGKDIVIKGMADDTIRFVWPFA